MKHFFLLRPTVLYALLLFLSNQSLFGQGIAVPVLSHERGIYDVSFDLQISAVDGVIYFTTDGSKPSESNGSVYTHPISIDKSIVVRAVAVSNGIYSAIETHTYIFLDQVIRQPRVISGWPNTVYPTDFRGNTATMDYEMDATVVDDPVYRDDLMKGLKDIPTLCLAMPLDNFWLINDNWQESETSVEIIYPDDPSASHQANGGIEGVSHRHLKRSYRLEFKSQYGPTKFRSDIMKRTAPLNRDNVEDRFDNLVLRAGTQRSWARNWVANGAAFIRDQWYRDSQIEMSGVSAHGTYVHLYVNAVYFGLFNLAERPNDEFMEDYLGGDSEEWFVLNHNGNLSGDPSRWDYLINVLILKDLSESLNYEEFKQYIDVEPFIDYLILSWMTGMVDWPNNNYYGSYRSSPQAAPMQFFAWDGEQSWDYEFGAHPGAWVKKEFRKDKVGGPPIAAIFNAAKHNPDFMMTFADRVYANCFHEGPLTDERQKIRWNILADFIKDAVVAESARWGDALEDGITRTRNEHWQQEVDRVDALMNGNVDRLMEALDEEDYYPTIDPPEWNSVEENTPSDFELEMTNPNNSGTIYYRIDGGDPRLDGGGIASEALIYDSEIPILFPQTITARVKDGNEWSALRKGSFIPNRPLNKVYINEWLASNSQDTTDASGVHEDWLEIYNGDSVVINIGGLYISNDLNNPKKWQIPSTNPELTQIEPGGFLILWADEDTEEGPTHLNFKLTAEGEVVGVFQEIGSSMNLLDLVSYGPQTSNISEGRFPDGSENIREFTTPTPARPNILPPSPPTIDKLFINEFLAENISDIADSSGAYEDWIEIYNGDSVAVDIGGLYITDELNEPLKWRIPKTDSEKTTIPPYRFLLLWADNDPEEGVLHLDFRLSTDGEEIGLVQVIDDEIQIIDSIAFPSQLPNISFGRLPNGGEAWDYTIYNTPGASNVLDSIIYDCAGIPNGTAVWDSCGECLEINDPDFNACLAKDTILFVVRSTILGLGDEVVFQTLQQMGYEVEVIDAISSQLNDAENRAAVLISSSVISSNIQDKFKDLAKPVMTWESYIYDDMKMTGPQAGKDFAYSSKQQSLYILPAGEDLTSGLSGLVEVSQASATFSWGKPGRTAISFAHIINDNSKISVFGYEANSFMADGFEAPAKRLGFFLHDNTAFRWTPEGKKLFESAVCWLLDCDAESPANRSAQDPNNFIHLYPNPSKTFTTLEWQSNSQEVVEFTLMDMIGKVYNRETWNVVERQLEKEISTTDLPSGMYIIQLRQGDKLYQKRLSVVK